MRFALVLVAAGCGYQEPGVGNDAGRLIDARLPDGPVPLHAQRRAITIDGTKVGNVTNFPVWIDLRGGDLPTKAQPDGSDIVFTDSNNTVIASELIAWQPGVRLAAWVKVAQLMANSNQTIYVRYGDTNVPPRDPKAVWDNGFVAVWHTNDSLGDGSVHDSTGTRDGTAAQGLGSNNVVAGPTSMGGGAFDFGGVKTVTFANPFSNNTTHMMSAWVNQGAGDGTFDAIVVVGNPNPEQSRWWYTNYQTADIAVGFFANDWNDVGTSINNAGWKLLHWTYASDRKSRMYVNGAQVGIFTHSQAPSTMGTAGYIGWSPTGWGANNGLTGQIAEVHLSVIQHSGEWIATEFNNQSSPSTFYSVGPEQQAP